MSEKWLTMYDVYFHPAEVSSVAGETTRAEFVLSVGKDGRKCLSKVRDVDISAEINSYAPGCDMAVILNKLQAGLIPTDYDESNCVDLTLLPKDVVEAVQKTREFRDQFSDFPVEVQKLFSYDPNVFMQSFIDGSLSDALATLKTSEPNPESKQEPKHEPKQEPKQEPKHEPIKE